MNRSPARTRWLRLVEGLAWTVGLSLIIFYAAVRFRGVAGTRREMRHFQEARATLSAKPQLPVVEPPDQSLWSPQRVQAWQAAREKIDPPPLAILRIPKIGLEAPVLEGTDDDTLNRALGHIEGTPVPGRPGNCGIAGHRDGFFRGLKDINPGDEMELQTLSGSEHFRVDAVGIVDPGQTEVLGPTSKPVLTLVTCYPFYFIGPAPRRCIVRAVLVSDDRTRVP